MFALNTCILITIETHNREQNEMTNAQINILNNEDAMAMIVVEAAKAVAEKAGCTVADVHNGLVAGNENCTNMFNTFVATGVEEIAKLVK